MASHPVKQLAGLWVFALDTMRFLHTCRFYPALGHFGRKANRSGHGQAAPWRPWLLCLEKRPPTLERVEVVCFCSR